MRTLSSPNLVDSLTVPKEMTVHPSRRFLTPSSSMYL